MVLLYESIGRYAAFVALALALLVTLSLKPWAAQPYVRRWIQSFWLISVGVALYVIPVPGPGLLEKVMASLRNGLIVLGFGFQMQAWALVRKRAWPTWAAWIPLGIFLAVYLAYWGEFRQRVFIISLCFGFISLAWAGSVGSGGAGSFRRLARGVRALVLLHALFHLVRAWVTWASDSTQMLEIWTALTFVELILLLPLLGLLEWMWMEVAAAGRTGRAPSH